MTRLDRREFLGGAVAFGAAVHAVSLWARASRVTGVDNAEAMLEEFGRAAAAAGVEAVAAFGRWPDVAAEVDAADVVVCAHVLYNVQELEPFVRALHEHARRRVVIEITSTHPLAWMSDLWLRFHDLQLGQPLYRPVARPARHQEPHRGAVEVLQ